MARPAPLLDQMGVLGDPLRTRLLLLLERHELTVGELCGIVQAPQSTVSRHLKILSDGAWLGARAEGTNRRYTMASETLAGSLRSLWLLVRKETASSLAAQQDDRRLADALASRRSRSEEFFRSESSRWDRLRDEMFGRRFFLPALLMLLDERAVVADLGCGTGHVASELAPFVRHVIGIDSSPAMLKAAARRLQSHGNVELRAGSLEALPVDDGSLDAAVMILVLHHVADPALAAAEAARALKPGGRLLVVDMFPHDREDYRSRMGHHWLGFAESDLRTTLERAGLGHVQFQALPAEPRAKGPALFAARAIKPAAPFRSARANPRRSR